MRSIRAALATAARLGAGSRVGATGPRPADELVLYEFESCPFCRKVREALVWLDLDVQVRPCPPGGARFRAERGPPYPLLVVGGEEIRESAVIVRELFARYGDGHVPWVMRITPLATVTSAVASLLLPGVRAQASRAPARPLELFADETSGEAREIRAWLCRLELPYRWRTCGAGSRKREELLKRTGDATLPALLDADAGADLRGAEAVIRHLRACYER